MDVCRGRFRIGVSPSLRRPCKWHDEAPSAPHAINAIVSLVPRFPLHAARHQRGTPHAINAMNTTCVAVIGLGYVGLPLATAFAQHLPTIGFDLNVKRIQALRQGADWNGELVPTRSLPRICC